MTTLTQKKLPVWAAEMNGESSLPSLYDIRKPGMPGDFHTSEEDGLWLNYDVVHTGFPYRTQDCYSRELTRDGLDSIVLENAHLRATFVPSLGGKLWSLFDKDAGKELLFANHVFRPAYLAIRNAWASGGVEWNCGAFPGHHPHTCEPMFTAIIEADKSGLGCPVLRMYTFERIRQVSYQLDFYLPEDAKFLHCRMRVVNDNYARTDMYWWSNIAVPTNPKARNVVPADYAFIAANGVTRVEVPHHNGIDVSYPTNNPVAIDYFYKCYEGKRPYTAHLDENGYGLCETSTSRLKGRKLFVWGQGQGGAKWQEYLSGDDGHGKYQDGKYCEIQCGLACSQFECLPMPPKTAWEWIEYYGPLTADPSKVHAEWKDAQKAVESQLDTLLPYEEMNEELAATHKMATTPAEKLLQTGLGWGALENERRKQAGMQPLCPHLDFGTCGKEQDMWVMLLKNGSLRAEKEPDDAIAPVSYQRSKEWVRLLERASYGPDRHFWLTHYLLGCAYLAECDLERAENELNTSCTLHTNAWNTYAIAELYRIKGDAKRSAITMLAAARMAPTNDSLCKLTARTLCQAEMWDALASFVDTLAEEQKRLPRIRLYRAVTAVHRDELDLAETLLCENDGLEIPDIQEGEISVTQLWYDIMEKKAARDGTVFDKATARPPKKFDFRMFVAD